ncbi:MAG: 3-hydroxyacyl-CoA dehydrogenase NAD-binding domain-containing protein [Sulfolobales archaeon]|nr:3-hydroxyacyl-CoA dehydrogenase NAD-binding domain-containing protein [Sulfolobales archaeon]MDW8082722.1 3-hydroxyacyl-CoA dehydrogenase NAD-binding domain-containing protein [Sulfolobales archaeon]
MVEFKRIAVIGFGVMGSSISQVFAQAGFEVYAVDISEEILRRGLENIWSGSFGLKKAVERGRITEEQAREALARIKTTVVLAEAVREADLVVEAAFEDLEVKRRLFKEVDSLAPLHAIIASNTSTLSITALAAVTRRPEKVVGMHFFNPPQVLKLVEVVRGMLTSDETVSAVKSLAERLGKVPIVCRDSPGFIANRIGILPILEALRLLDQGVASANDIDTAMKLGYNWPMGPLELADFIGLDVLLGIAEVLYRETGSPAYHPPPVLRRLVAAGYLGRKTGRGIYTYK